jgi:hypothetical protein
LEAVLEAIEWTDVDAVFCGGDLVGYGPDPNEVCALIIKTLRTESRVRLNQRHGILHFTIIRGAGAIGADSSAGLRIHVAPARRVVKAAFDSQRPNPLAAWLAGAARPRPPVTPRTFCATYRGDEQESGPYLRRRWLVVAPKTPYHGVGVIRWSHDAVAATCPLAEGRPPGGVPRRASTRPPDSPGPRLRTTGTAGPPPRS